MPSFKRKSSPSRKPKGLRTLSPKAAGEAAGKWGPLKKILDFFREEREKDAAVRPVPLDKTTLTVAGFFTLFIVVVLWPVLSRPDYTPGGYDMTTAIPFKWLWIESLKNLHPVFWTPYTSVGQPFLPWAIYSPFNLLFFIIHPISYAFTWNYVVHFLFAALFTYFFIRGLGCGWQGACLGTLAFIFSGFFMGHYYWGHPLIVWAVCWMPVFMFGLQRFVNGRSFAGLFLASVALGLTILEGYPQVNMYDMIIGGLWLGWAWIGRKINWKELAGAEAVLMFISFSIGWCQLVPSYEFATLSNRWVMPFSDVTKDVFMPQYFHFFLDPFFLGGPGHGDYKGMWGYQEVVAYVGLAPLFLSLAGFLALMKRRPVVWWFALVAILATLLAMGTSTAFSKPVFMFFFNYLPGFGKNRSLARIMVLTFFALACLAGLGLEAWMAYWRKKAPAGMTRKILAQWVPIALLTFTVLDLGRFALYNTASGGCSYDYRDYWDPTRMMDPKIIKAAQDDPTYPRVQPETTADSDYELLQKVQAVATGYPIELEWTAQYLGQQWAYSETPLPDLICLKYRWRLSDFVSTERWQPVPGTINYWTDTKAFPRAFMTAGHEVDPDFNQAIIDIRDGKVDPREEVILAKEPADQPSWTKGWVGEAKITRYDWNDVEMECDNDRPCFLFLSDSYFPEWRAWVDGKEEAICQADGAFRAVEIQGTGHHRVRMSFYPRSYIYSFLYSFFFWILLAFLWAYRGKLEAWYSSLFGGRLIFATPLEVVRAQAREQKGRNAGGKPRVRRRKK